MHTHTHTHTHITVAIYCRVNKCVRSLESPVRYNKTDDPIQEHVNIQVLHRLKDVGYDKSTYAKYKFTLLLIT
jgi:hypothetical protein